MKRKPDAPWDHTVHEERKQAKVDKKSKELIAQIYDALDVDPDDMYDTYELRNAAGGVVYQVKTVKVSGSLPAFKAARGGIRFNTAHTTDCRCAICTGKV